MTISLLFLMFANNCPSVSSRQSALCPATIASKSPASFRATSERRPLLAVTNARSLPEFQMLPGCAACTMIINAQTQEHTVTLIHFFLVSLPFPYPLNFLRSPFTTPQGDTEFINSIRFLTSPQHVLRAPYTRISPPTL